MHICKGLQVYILKFLPTGKMFLRQDWQPVTPQMYEAVEDSQLLLRLQDQPTSCRNV